MNGTYTVNPNGGDYATIGAAISALEFHGVSGPVIINIASGVYPEALEIEPIQWATDYKTITFRSATGSAADVIIAPTTSSMSNGSAAIFVNGADHIRFEYVTVDALVNGIYYTGDVVGLRFKGCIIQGDPSANTWGIASFLSSSSTDLRIEECVFSACFQAISAVGSSLSIHYDTIIRNNAITSTATHARGISAGYVEDLTIEGNTIDLQAPLPTTVYHASGIAVLNGSGVVRVAGNSIIAGTGGYGLSLVNMTIQASAPCLVENNMVRLVNAYTSVRGVRISNMDHLAFRHNTVRCEAGHPALDIGLDVTQSTFTGNILSCPNADAVVTVQAPAGTLIDRNLFEVQGSTVAEYRPHFFSQYTPLTFAAWQALGYDANSIIADPQFLSTTDLHIAPTSPAVGLAPFPATVAVDIDGEPRPGMASDLVEAGADELDECVPMSGTYAIGTGTSAHFANLNAAKNALYQCGISGPVTFSIAPGTYTEYLSFDPEVPGASATNVIRWRGQSGNNTSVEWRPPTGYIPLLSITAVDHMVFENFTLSRTNGQGSTLVTVNNAGAPVCQGLVFRNVRFLGKGNSGLTNHLVSSANADAAASASFEGCTFQNGAVAIKWTGAAGEKLNISQSVATGCRVFGFQLSGMGTGLGVVENTITSNSGLAAAIRMSNCNGSFRVSDNRIDISGTGTGNAVGMELVSCLCTASKRGGVMNNTIISLQRTRSIGIRMVGTTSYVDVWNNSISIQNSNNTGSPLEITSGSNGNNNRINNNIFRADGAYALYNYSGASVGTLRNNVLFTTQADLAYWGGARADLPALQAASSQFVGSQEAEPLFISANSDLHIQATSPAVAAAHAPTSTPGDIDGESRPRPAGTSPDIGADEVDQTAPAGGAKRLDEATNAVRYFPNPVNDLLTITTDEPRSTQYRVIDLQGRTALAGRMDLPGVMDLSNVEAGTYLLLIDAEEKAVRIVVQH